MPIPLFMTEIVLDGTDTVSKSGGSGGTVSVPAGNYYLATNKTSSGTGQSFMTLLGSLLTTADGTNTWTCKISTTYTLQITHNAGSAQTISISENLGRMLGWFFQDASASPTSVTNGATGALCLIPPLWLWSPDMPVSFTGPELFDPTQNIGIPSSAGSAHRAPDMTASYVRNGVQYEAELGFNGVGPYYKARPPKPLTDLNSNRDFETWWRFGPSLGRKILYWRDRSNVAGQTAPSAGSAQPYNYVEYQPTDELRASPPMRATNPPGLVYWDIRLPMWVTSRGEGIF